MHYSRVAELCYCLTQKYDFSEKKPKKSAVFWWLLSVFYLVICFLTVGDGEERKIK